MRVIERVAGRATMPGQARRDLTRRLLDVEAVGTVLREASRPVRDEERVAIAGFGAPLEALLSDLGPEHFDAVLSACVHTGVDEVKSALTTYLAKHAEGNEEKLGQLLGDADLGRARVMLAILARVDNDAARRALKNAEHSASAELRVEAVAIRAARSAGDLKDELTALLADPDPAIRAAALRTMAHYTVKEAGPALSKRIQSPAFHKLALDERRLALDTLQMLSPARGEAVALELASRAGIITRGAHDETRLLAIELLARVSSEPGTLEVLDELSEKWSNADAVRKAAAEAAQVIRARLGGGVERA
jgi:hypothetical protein